MNVKTLSHIDFNVFRLVQCLVQKYYNLINYLTGLKNKIVKLNWHFHCHLQYSFSVKKNSFNDLTYYILTITFNC